MLTKTQKIVTPSRNLLSAKAVLAAVSVSQWTARRLDKEVTNEINDRKGAKTDAGRYNKLLIDAKHLEPITHAVSAARMYHEKVTQPWLDDGYRILPTMLYADWSSEIDGLIEDFNAAVNGFVRVYPDAVEDSRKRLGSMFKAADFPHVEEIRAKFVMRKKSMPCPDAADFRTDLADEHADDIRASIEQSMKEALDNAMNEPVMRIVELVGRMADRMKTYKPGKREGSFRSSLVENLQELVYVLPAFNLTGNKAIAELTDRINDELCQHDADELKKNERLRKSVGKAADEILAKAQELMA